MKKIDTTVKAILEIVDRPMVHYGLVIIFLLISFLARIQFFYRGDMLFLVDQARDMMLVKEIAVNHKITLIGARAGFGGLFHGPLWLYMVVPSFLIFQGSPFWTLAPIFVLVSMCIVIGGYVIGRVLYGKRMGLLFMAFLATSATLIHMVPLTTNAHIMPLIFLIYLLSIFKYLRSNNKWLIMTGLCIGLGFQFEAAFGVFFLPGLLLALVLKRKIPSIHIIIAGLACFLFLISNFLIFELRHKFIMLQSVLKLFYGKNDPIKGYEQYANYLFRLEDHAMGFVHSFSLPFSQASNFLLILALLIVMTTGFILIWNQVTKKKSYRLTNEFVFLLGFTILFYGLFTLYPFPLWEHYVYPITISSTLLIVLSIQVIGKFFLGKVALAALLISTLFISITGLFQIYAQPATVSTSDGSLKNQAAAVDWVYQDSDSRNVNYLVYTPGALTYNMDYLMWWRGQYYNKVPSNQKQAVTYVISYPSSQGAYDFWKKNVIHTSGKILDEHLVAGGIRVEKLTVDINETAVDPNYYVNLTFR